jgi:hypothetical protein
MVLTLIDLTATTGFDVWKQRFGLTGAITDFINALCDRNRGVG